MRSRLRNPYHSLHRKLLGFAREVNLDPVLVARNEYLRSENMILRGMLHKRQKHLCLSLQEKDQLIPVTLRLTGRTKESAPLLSPAQIVRHVRSAAGKKYASMYPKAPRVVKTPIIHLESIIRSIVEEHPTWVKQNIYHEIRKYFPEVPAFRVYDILYDIGFWDGQKNNRGLPWKEFLARFENVTWAGDFFSVPAWTEYGLITNHVLFFVNLGTQRVFIAGTSPHATADWLVQKIKSWTDLGSPFGPDARFLIRDRDRRYTQEVDWYFTQIGLLPKKVAPGAPVMNCYAEQFVRKIKHECLNHCMFLSEQALRSTIATYVDYYHTQRPHSKFRGGCIIENATHYQREGPITRIESLPGLLGYYYRTPKRHFAVNPD